jgi:hypothetical protein
MTEKENPVTTGPTMRDQVVAAKFVCETFSGAASDDTTALSFLLAGARAFACDLERQRCLAVLDDMIEAAEKRRKGHHATPWLKHARDAVASGIDPRELEDGVLSGDGVEPA